VWDTFFPLFLLTREDGPCFTNRKWPWFEKVAPSVSSCRIRLQFPAIRKVCNFFTDRCSKGWGFTLRCDRPKDIEPPRPYASSGDCLALGNGKDSRMLLGALRETGRTPTVYGHMRGEVNGIAVRRSDGFSGYFAERVMPTLMSGSSHIYWGMGSGEAWYSGTPWQLFHDVSAHVRLSEISSLLQSVGIGVSIHAPLAVLPYNITQKILCSRYPALATGQVSTKKQEHSAKNLRTSVLKLWAGVAPWDFCSKPLFHSLLDKWLSRQVEDHQEYGTEIETRALLTRMLDLPQIRPFRDRIPKEWDVPWVDYLHPHVAPVDASMMRIFREYADPVPSNVLHVPVENLTPTTLL